MIIILDITPPVVAVVDVEGIQVIIIIIMESEQGAEEVMEEEAVEEVAAGAVAVAVEVEVAAAEEDVVADVAEDEQFALHFTEQSSLGDKGATWNRNNVNWQLYC